MGLKDWLKPAWKDKDRDTRLAAVNELTTQKHLISVALNDDDGEIRETALNRIDMSTLWEPQLLRRIAVSDRPWDTRLVAVDRIEDDNVLCDIACREPNPIVRWAALRRMENETLYEKVARSDAPDDIRIAALAHVEDEDALKQIFEAAQSEWIKEAAVRQIHDAEWLDSVARGDSIRWVRVAAVENIDDVQLLSSIAETEMDPFVKKAAIENIDNADVLARFRNDPSELVKDAVRTRMALSGDESLPA
ncbi:MAG: hypothetical protein JXX14_24535 [Deltaproteobacteria bacterium]|nr:hypothetical protein [Deltaproteobacteria bacterium]